MTASHTPGPWSYWPKSAYPQGVISQDATTTHIAIPALYPDAGITTANARLIAAAPDLLRELVDLVDWMDFNQRSIEGEFLMDDLLADARAAIAKAKGN